MAEATTHHALGDRAAFQLANFTKTPPQYGATPREEADALVAALWNLKRGRSLGLV